MVSSRSPGVNLSPANTLATSRVVVSDSDVAHDGDAILPNTPQSYRAKDEGGRLNGTPGGTEWSQSGPPSLSMSVDLHNLVSSNLQDSGHYSASPEQADGGGASCNIRVIGSNDDEESYEAFGSVEGDADDGVDSPGGSSSAPSPTGTNSLRNPRSPNSTIGRHSWLRTSLRRTPSSSAKKRLSSNALASQLYRSSSFNSSGRGSNCDPTDDMYSDVSLEDDVIDLNRKTTKRKKDANQNYPTEFIQCSDIASRFNGRYSLVCDECDYPTLASSTLATSKKDKSLNHENVNNRNSNIIEMPSVNEASTVNDTPGGNTDSLLLSTSP